MTRIGLLSDTHAFWDDKYLKYFENCDEIWHAGDIGSVEVARNCPLSAPSGLYMEILTGRTYADFILKPTASP